MNLNNINIEKIFGKFGANFQKLIEENIYTEDINFKNNLIKISMEKNYKLLNIIIDDKNIVHKRKIIANKVYQNNWIIEQGLENGDIVVFEGVQKIFEGAPTISVFATDQFKK